MKRLFRGDKIDIEIDSQFMFGVRWCNMAKGIFIIKFGPFNISYWR